MSSLLEVTCLGEFTARLDGIALPALTNSKPLAIWLYLATERVPRSRAHMAEFFWGELGDEAARGNLRLALMRLRKYVPEHIRIGRDTVCVPADCRFVLDAQQVVPPEPEAVADLDRLLLLRPEELLASLRLRHAPQFDEWVSATREQLVSRYLALLSAVADRLVAGQQTARAIELLRRCLALVPWSESHHRALISCYASLGQRAPALAQLDACRRALRAQLDVEPAAETLALARTINALPEATKPPPADPLPELLPDNTHAPNVVRVREQAYLAQLLDDPACRVVSIVGPGGAGKTHLAQRMAQRLGGHFSDGALFVSLADVEPLVPDHCVSLVEKRIAEAMRLPGGTLTRELLLLELAGRELLLILDNFEQLVQAAELVDAIALRAPRVRVLVTTRRRLGLATEWAVAIDGLAVPEEPTWSDEAAAYPAVELFVKVAERVVPQFDATANGASILRICRSVGGLPLALIIAARWLTTLQCSQIAAQLDSSSSLLNLQPADGHAQPLPGIAAVLDRSWTLLGESERHLFRALGVFRGGFTAEDALAVCGSSLDVLDRLVTQSLVRNRGDGRLIIHELTRDYAEHRLAETPELALQVRHAHARHYAARLADELERFQRDPLQTDFLEARTELSNLIAALDHLAAQGAIDAVLALLDGLWAFHKRMGWFADGAALLRRGLGIAGLPLEPACRLRLWLSDACFQMGHHGEGKEAVLESLAHAREPVPEHGAALYAARELLRRLLPWAPGAAVASEGMPEDISRTHNRLAQLYFFEGDRLRFLGSTLRSIHAAANSDAAGHWASGALALAHVPLHGLAAGYARRAARTVDDAEPFTRAWAHEQLALYYLGVADLDAAERHAAMGSTLFRALGQHKNWGESSALFTYPAMFRCDLPEATRRFTSNLDFAREVRELFAEIWSVCGLTHIALRRGESLAGWHADLTGLEPVVGRLVDPNTDVLYFGNMAWLCARMGLVREALNAINTCQLVVRSASMLSVYATNGFIGQMMALVELASIDGASPAQLDAAAATALRDFARFARPFTTAQPYRLYCQGRWWQARGDAARGQSFAARALARLPLPVDPTVFNASFAGAA